MQLTTTTDIPLDLPQHLIPYVEQVNQLQRIGHNFWSRGWSLGTSSNYSVVVNPQRGDILVTASGKDKGHLASADFVLLDKTGKPTVKNQPKSSAETLLHIEAAQQFNAKAILHTHSVWGTILSDKFHVEKGFYLEGYEMLKGLGKITSHQTKIWIPIFENTQHIPNLVKEIQAYTATTTEPLYAYLIHKHGLYTWGESLSAASRQIEVLEFLFECKGRLLGL
ncbi:MAG: methylthioribulose 1-phosphate dehydratase [Pirellulaceae bacterium]|nr:methylthioribulose 1-phosphate dehydratase [Pirellulaceae bacterium]